MKVRVELVGKSKVYRLLSNMPLQKANHVGEYATLRRDGRARGFKRMTVRLGKPYSGTKNNMVSRSRTVPYPSWPHFPVPAFTAHTLALFWVTMEILRRASYQHRGVGFYFWKMVKGGYTPGSFSTKGGYFSTGCGMYTRTRNTAAA